MTLPQHLSTSEHYITPQFISDAYREVLESNIALDPATSASINSLYIKATNYYTEADNGLEKPWNAANVFLNFPSSKTLNSEYRKKYGDVCCKVWFNKFVDEFLKGNFETGLIVLFSNSHLNILNFDFVKLKGVVQVCTLKQRLNFEVIHEDKVIVKNQPTHHSSIVYVGQDTNTFAKVFNKFGNVWEHYYSIYCY